MRHDTVTLSCGAAHPQRLVQQRLQLRRAQRAGERGRAAQRARQRGRPVAGALPEEAPQRGQQRVQAQRPAQQPGAARLLRHGSPVVTCLLCLLSFWVSCLHRLTFASTFPSHLYTTGAMQNEAGKVDINR